MTSPAAARAGISLGGRTVASGAACYVIAEGGVNHDGQVALAHRLVDAAADAGADAIKFQTFDPDALATAEAPKAGYQLDHDGAGSQLDMLRRLVLSREAHVALQRHARERGIAFLSTPFDEASADFLVELGVPALKVPSGEITNHAFLAHLAGKGLPMLMSTGMAHLAEVRDAVEALRRAGDPPLALFHCVSRYPAPFEDANLRAMATLAEAFSVPVGWSDHTQGIDLAGAAVALGASLLEKHLTLDRTMSGPDHAMSVEPAELARMIATVRHVESALGSGEKRPTAAEAETARVARKSLHWSRAIAAGERVQRGDLVALRPGTGISPARLEAIVGRVLKAAVAARAMVREEDLST